MRYKAIVSYDGTRYAGWQSQGSLLSIQDELNKAISRITNEEIKIAGAGRTDAKVHAYGQVFQFDTDKIYKDIKHAINSQLPEDIDMVSIEQTDDQFHSRFSAKWKHYDYIINDKEYSPLLANYAAQVKGKLDLSAMRNASEVLLGTHDFTSFNATKIKEIEDQVRTIYKIEIKEENNLIKISYYGNGFLRYMIRILSETLIQVGLGKITKDDVLSMLQAKDKTACHYNGDPQGLYLVEVGYSDYQD